MVEPPATVTDPVARGPARPGLPRWFWPVLASGLVALLVAIADTGYGVATPGVLLLPVVIGAAALGGRGPGLATAGVVLGFTVWFYGMSEAAPRMVLSGPYALTTFASGTVAALAFGLWLGEVLYRERRAVGDAERTAADLRKSEARLRTFVDQVKEYAIFTMSPEGRNTSWNAGVERVLGFGEAEFLGEHARQIFPPEDRTAGAAEQELRTAAEVGQALDDRWMVRKDGSRFFAMGMTTALYGERGELVGFTKVLRDHTERKKAEEALAESETRYRLVAKAIREAVWDWNLDRDTVEWNEALQSQFGYPPERMASGSEWWRDLIHPDDRPAVFAAFQRALGETEQFWTVQFRMRREDGTYALVLLRALIERDDRALPKRVVGTIADITDRKRAEDQLAQAQRMEAVGRLAGGVAHDLNNMLTSIIGYGSLLARGLAPDDPRRADVHQVLRAAERSAALTRSLLAFARRELVQPRTIDLNGVLAGMERVLRPLLGESITLELRLAAGVGAIWADPGQLEQIVLNLVLNARDAMPRGGRVLVETASEHLTSAYVERHYGTDAPAGRYVLLAVSDTGHGMDRETLDRIFEPFFTTKPQGQGTGLGLSTVYGAVKQSGGFVWADSEPGQGATFKVYFPEVPHEASPAGSAPGAERRRPGNETVLLVEDEELVRTLARRALEAEGYRCLVAEDGRQAAAMLERIAEPIQLVVTDVIMPGMNGPDLVERVRDVHHGIPVLYTSGYTGEDIVRRGLIAEGEPFLQKPFTPDRLIERVREVLDRARGVAPGQPD